jgi:hypothetical protein
MHRTNFGLHMPAYAPNLESCVGTLHPKGGAGVGIRKLARPNLTVSGEYLTVSGEYAGFGR